MNSLMGVTFCVHTFGCQMNKHDSERVAGMLENLGAASVDEIEDADIVVFMTCCVREAADTRLYGQVASMKNIPLREGSPLKNRVIAVGGCIGQRDGYKLVDALPHLNIVFGTNNLSSLPALVMSAIEDGRHHVEILESTDEFSCDLPTDRENSWAAWLPITIGCNNFCTYCIVPYVRGRERSRQPEVILREVQHLIQDGYKEIMLLGQNVNSYGKDLEQPISFAELLRKINAMEGEFVIRFMSSHPKDATPELLDTILSCEKVGQHLHLPVQCGSDAILSAMNRRYTVEQYLKTVDYLRERRPDFSLTSDLIVGFPNESEADFQGTLDLIQRVQYDNLYTFIYSKRSGTKAANMPDATSDAEKRQRMERLLTLQREIATKNYRRFLGRTMRVLVEGDSKRGDGWLFGKSNEAIIVEFMGNRSLIGTFVSVQITESKNWAVSGRLLDDERKEAVQK